MTRKTLKMQCSVFVHLHFALLMIYKAKRKNTNVYNKERFRNYKRNNL